MEEIDGDGSAAFWDQLYGERQQLWSGQPNVALTATVSGLVPGRALDLGCGEGADSLWLAEQGWAVTGVDVSATAVARAAREAEARGRKIDWRVEDLVRWQPTGPFDLVSACFLQSPIEFPRLEILRRAAGSVAAGGHLLSVAHAEAPPWGRMSDHEGHDGHRHDLLVDPASELAGLQLDPTGWETVVAERRRRRATGPDGQQATIDDSVVLLRRR